MGEAWNAKVGCRETLEAEGTKKGRTNMAIPWTTWASSIRCWYCTSGGPSVGMLKCSAGEGPDPRGKDTDYLEDKDPMAEVVAAEGVSKVT